LTFNSVYNVKNVNLLISMFTLFKKITKFTKKAPPQYISDFGCRISVLHPLKSEIESLSIFILK
jgi:hypothetical protein